MEKEFIEYQKILERTGDLESKKNDHCKIIDSFYAESIIQIENSEKPIVRKDILKTLEIKNLNGVISVNTKIKEVKINKSKGIIWGKMVINFETSSSKKSRLKEVFIQKWKEGKIIYQRFLYGDSDKLIEEKLNLTLQGFEE